MKNVVLGKIHAVTKLVAYYRKTVVLVCASIQTSIITPGCVRGFVRPSVRACVRAYV